MKRVTIIGGGLAGLISAIMLKKGGTEVTLIEKNEYPFHRVCGEYVSNEVIPFLKKNDLWPAKFHPADITNFELTDTTGKPVRMPLDLGGFGISRYALDGFFIEKAMDLGVEVLEGTRVEEITFHNDEFEISTRKGTLNSPILVGAYGKRSHLDKRLDRSFMKRRSPYIGVKYHVRNAPHQSDTVALHNFNGGYCGLNAVENGTFNLCYLSHRDNLREYKDIAQMEKKVLCRNPHLEKIFSESEFLWDAPLVINEISFETKEPVINHVLMCGDAAGMITPLCGNGMAMAIHSGKILSECILSQNRNGNFNRTDLENEYRKAWNNQFSLRLSTGRQIQRLFGRPFFSKMAVSLGRNSRPIAKFLMSKTHGVPFH